MICRVNLTNKTGRGCCGCVCGCFRPPGSSPFQTATEKRSFGRQTRNPSNNGPKRCCRPFRTVAVCTLESRSIRLRAGGLTASGVSRSLHMFVGSLTEASEQVRAVSLALGNGPTIMCCGRAAPILASAERVKATERFRPRPSESASWVSVSPRTRQRSGQACFVLLSRTKHAGPERAGPWHSQRLRPLDGTIQPMGERSVRVVRSTLPPVSCSAHVTADTK